MKNINSQVLRKTFAARFILARFILARFTLVRFVLAAILIPALLIGSAFTFGGSKLQAQAVQSSSKLGFFVGIAYLSGFKVDTTTRVTTNSTTITDAITTGYRIDVDRGNGGYGAASYRIEATSGHPGWDATTATGIRALVSANCESSKTSVNSNGEYFFSQDTFISFDSGAKPSLADILSPTNDATVTFLDRRFPSTNFRSGLATTDDPSLGVIQETSHCYSYFSQKTKDFNSSTYEVTPDSPSNPTSVPADPIETTSSKSDQLSGIGLQFGFRWEKWRASLTHFTGKGGANELANTLVMADYFVNKGLFVGGGLASMKLTSGSANGYTSGSATSPALRVGYKQKLTPNLSLNFGLTKYISGVSLKSSVTTTTTTTPPTTPTNTTPIMLRSFQKTQTGGDSATIGMLDVVGNGSSNVFRYFTGGNTVDDGRVEVTQFHSRTVYIKEIQIPAGSETQTTTTTETDAELKAPLVISISFHLTF